MEADGAFCSFSYSAFKTVRIALVLTILCLYDNVHGNGGYPSRTLHRIRAKDQFVILDGEEAQRFRIFGFLPFLQTNVVHSILLFCTFASLLLAPLLVFWSQRRQRVRIAQGLPPQPILNDLWSFVPDPLARLAFYLHLEVSAYVQALLEEVMSFVGAPLSLGLSLASRISSGNLASHLDSSYDSYSEVTAVQEGSKRRHKPPSLMKQGGYLSKPSAPSKPGSFYPGLWNTGNSCFLNSTLQNLASVAPLEGFLETIIEQAERWDVPTPVTDALFDIFVQLNSPLQSRSAIIPRQLTDALSNLPQANIRSFFYAHQQQDAHELLVLVTSALDDEIKAIEREREAVQRAQMLGLRAIFAPSVPSTPTACRIMPFANPFRSLIAQRTACLDCGYVEAVRHYPSDDLSLTVPPRSGSATTIEACLTNWSRLEVVDWICFRCSVVRTLDRVRAEAAYLATSANGGLSPSSANGQALSISAKKKSGAKRKRLRETKEKEAVLIDILRRGLSEDEDETKTLLAEIPLERTFSRAATKQVMLARTPSILVLHLNRSSYSASNFGASKNNSAVLFDERLDISEIVTGGDLTVRGDRPISRGATPMNGVDREEALWSTKSAKASASSRKRVNGHDPLATDANGYLDESLPMTSRTAIKTQFLLCAIVVHYGGHSSGHYVAFRRRKKEDRRAFNREKSDSMTDVDEFGSSGVEQMFDGRHQDDWYRISDDSVSRCSWHDVRVQNPFILFYERVGDQTRHANGQTVTNCSLNGHGEYDAAKGNTHIPNGFEAIAQKVQNAKPLPRVVQRWETMPIDRVKSMSSRNVKVENADHAGEMEDGKQEEGEEEGGGGERLNLTNSEMDPLVSDI